MAKQIQRGGRGPDGDAAPARDLTPTEPAETSGAVALRTVQAAFAVTLSPCEEVFAREFVLRRNATAAYIEAHDTAGMQRHVIRQRAWEMSHRPHVLARVREYESAAAAATVIDVQSLLERDRAIVDGYDNHADEVTQFLRTCCRYCNGREHKYQWVDFAEYLATLAKAEETNEERRARKVREVPLPTDEGGYGYSPQNEPSMTCPQCEGFGLERVIFADTTKLEGGARAIVRGVKVTANGTEILMHDYDKAKDRLLRAAGAYHDDAASVAGAAARGAAAGSAAGAAAAQAVAAKVKDMTADEARRAYLALVS